MVTRGSEDVDLRFNSEQPDSRKLLEVLLEFHIPEPILGKIVTLLSVDCVAELERWIRTGAEGGEWVVSAETLRKIRLDRIPYFVSWARHESTYQNFFLEYLKSKNPYTFYAESLRLALCCGKLKEALEIAREIKQLSISATLLFIVLNHCSHIPWTIEEKEFIEKFDSVSEIEKIGGELKNQIKCLSPKNEDSYGKGQWYSNTDLDCRFEHEAVERILKDMRTMGDKPFGEMAEAYNGNICIECIIWYLSQEICSLS